MRASAAAAGLPAGACGDTRPLSGPGSARRCARPRQEPQVSATGSPRSHDREPTQACTYRVADQHSGDCGHCYWYINVRGTKNCTPMTGTKS
jgi:hypothetical protein